MEIGAVVLAGLTLGFATGFHCLGMCGPIALTLGMNRTGQLRYHLGNISYQMGRIVTYTLLGVLAGLIGEGFGLAIPQRWVSVLAGILIIVLAFTSFVQPGGAVRIALLDKALHGVRGKLATLLKKNSVTSRFGLGLLNGLLPCGMVYVALTSSLGTGSWSTAALFMLCFGLGTFPFMFCMVLFGSFMTQKLRFRVLKVMPFVMLLLGVLFILRGMDLNIPYLSPPEAALQTSTDAARPRCH